MIAPPSPGLRTPLQRRSQRTLQRLLSATEQLLEKRAFDEIGVQQIVRAARSSVGAFYTRFEDKGALLTALYTRYDEGLAERIASWRADQGPPPTDLTGAAAWIARYLVSSFRSRRNLLRALALHVRANPEVVDEAARERRAAQHEFLHEALRACRTEIAGRDPERAIQSAVFFAVSACRERILFAETAHARKLPRSDAQLVTDVARMIVGTLQTPALSP